MNPEKSVPAQAEKIFQLPSREAATSSQLGNLLTVFNVMAGFLTTAQAIENDPERGGKLDGGAKESIEATIIKVCSRIDDIVDQQERWTLRFQNTLEKSLTNAYNANARMLNQQARAFAEASSPHARYKPELVKLANGDWLAFSGNPHDLDNAVMGVGDCPERALEAYDALFKGGVPKHLKNWIEKEKQKQNEQQKSLDPGTNKATQDPKSQKGFRRRYGAGSGADSGSGAEPNKT